MHPLCYSDQMALLDNFVELLSDHKYEDSDLLSSTEAWIGQLSGELTFTASVRRQLEDVLQIVRAGEVGEATDLARSALVYLTQSGGPAARPVPPRCPTTFVPYQWRDKCARPTGGDQTHPPLGERELRSDRRRKPPGSPTPDCRGARRSRTTP